MKQVSEAFKQAIKEYGRQIDVIIEYEENGVNKMLNTDTLFSVTPIVRANLLKSAMKQLNFESYEKVPKDTWLHIKFGILIDNALTVADVHKMRVDRLNSTQVRQLQGFEYISFGDYIVTEEPEYNADTLNYSHKCYDKMIFAMKDYEPLNITYPITIKNYLSALASKIGLTLKSSTFYNENKTILNELYLDTDGNSLGYTYRDVLDEIAQATGSIICINNNDELEVRYLTETNETIDGDMLKDIDIGFKEHYGSINTIVLSRSAGADNIYYPDPLPINPIELKIADNQILNYDNRSDYIQGIYNALNGTNYYINDFKSTGICYLELGDKYNVEIDGVTYNCVLLNDEIDITQGLEEQIHTDLPEQSETDYSKADKTDRKINQTTFIVDKQNQQIQGIISQIGDRSQKTTTITADIDGLNSRVEDIEDLTNEVNGIKTVILENCIQGSLLELHIYGNNTVFDNLYPQNDLYPANDLYPYGDSRIVVTDENNNSITYELGITEVLRQNGNVKDEYILQNSQAKVIRRINADGTIKANEVIEDLGEFHIDLASGTNTITIKNYTATLKAKYAIKSDYTEVFATKVEMSSSITQTAEEINFEVRKKVDENEVISKINQSAESVQINANKISLGGKNINLTGDDITISSNNFNVDEYGNMTCNNANVNGTISSNNATITGGKFNVTGSGSASDLVRVTNSNDSSQFSYLQPVGAGFVNGNSRIDIFTNGQYSGGGTACSLDVNDDGGNTVVRGEGIKTPNVTQTSLESEKKNFEKFNNALDIIKNIDIYKYNLKSENDKSKKHIGFVIGDKYNYSKEITSKENDGADIYSFVSLCCQAIKEQQEEIEKLRKEINDG